MNDPDWTPEVNDAWVQGAIDARKSLYIASPMTRENLLDPKYGVTVFGREIDQLKKSGYTIERDYLLPPKR